jgi:DNA-binding CsgD family transcriptional regulator
MNSFTPRQRQVIGLLVSGRSNVEVASALGISPRTAKAHTDEIRRRLGVAKRRQIPYAYYLATGQLPLGPEPPAA